MKIKLNFSVFCAKVAAFFAKSKKFTKCFDFKNILNYVNRKKIDLTPDSVGGGG